MNQLIFTCSVHKYSFFLTLFRLFFPFHSTSDCGLLHTMVSLVSLAMVLKWLCSGIYDCDVAISSIVHGIVGAEVVIGGIVKVRDIWFLNSGFWFSQKSSDMIRHLSMLQVSYWPFSLLFYWFWWWGCFFFVAVCPCSGSVSYPLPEAIVKWTQSKTIPFRHIR